jgi:hypothetical protein
VIPRPTTRLVDRRLLMYERQLTEGITKMNL